MSASLLQSSKREVLQQLSSRAALESTARDTNKQIAAVKAQTAKLQGEIEAIQQSVTAIEVTLSHYLRVCGDNLQALGLSQL